MHAGWHCLPACSSGQRSRGCNSQRYCPRKRLRQLSRISMVKHVPPPDLQSQLVDLGTLVQLIKRVRHAATVQELGFIIVNETHSLLPYRQAVLWRADATGSGSIAAISGTPIVERNAPFTLWLTRALGQFAKIADATKVTAIDAGEAPAALREDWAEWLPTRGLWIPLNSSAGHKLGAVFVARAEPWSEADQYLAQELADGYGHAWAALLGGRPRRALS